MKQNIIQAKKGIALNQAFGAVLTLVLIGVLVIIAIFLFVTLGDSFDDIEESVINETGAYLNISGYTLVNSTDCNFNTPSLNAIWGNTPSQALGYNLSIPLANATLDTTTAIVTNATIVFNASIYDNVSLSYSYKQGGAACTATNTMVVQFGNYPALVGLIGTIIFLGIVIGVLVASFVFGRRQGV